MGDSSFYQWTGKINLAEEIIYCYTPKDSGLYTSLIRINFRQYEHAVNIVKENGSRISLGTDYPIHSKGEIFLFKKGLVSLLNISRNGVVSRIIQVHSGHGKLKELEQIAKKLCLPLPK